MSTFHLPDLGEGLAEATIHEWYVNTGDVITIDAPMVSVETAKALVDIPAPFNGRVVKIFANAGDVCKTGAALIEIETDEKTAATVAGKLSSEEIILAPETDFLSEEIIPPKIMAWQKEAVSLTGLRLGMAKNMARAHASVAAASIFEEADITHLPEKPDITVLIAQAICAACQAEPALSAWYDGRKQVRLLHQTVHLGLAVDTPQGLYVPVIKDVQTLSATQIRTHINETKKALLQHSLPATAFQGATITLSNIGGFAGRFATPMVMPPTVAIIAVGRVDAMTKRLPLSLSFDHRVVTGGEAARFLAAMLKYIASLPICK